jgi:hypothetical protein
MARYIAGFSPEARKSGVFGAEANLKAGEIVEFRPRKPNSFPT